MKLIPDQKKNREEVARLLRAYQKYVKSMLEIIAKKKAAALKKSIR